MDGNGGRGGGLQLIIMIVWIYVNPGSDGATKTVKWGIMVMVQAL